MRMRKETAVDLNIDRLPKDLQEEFRILYHSDQREQTYLSPNALYHGDAREILRSIQPNSISLSVWSPPYFVGKEYESHLTFDGWQTLLKEVIALHFPIIQPGGFLVINIADILCFRDPMMPRVQADVIHRKRSGVTKEEILRVWAEHPDLNRYQIAKMLGCSEQTIDRRLNGNNIRGGKYEAQTRVKVVGGLIEEWALSAGFFPYDRRVWVKDPAWENSRWASLSYRAVDEFEYIYIFWKPGVTRYDRQQLTAEEWKEWGSRAVWEFPSVRTNDDHEAKFPLELPLRVIRLLTDPGDIVLDCFVGSGTTAVACIRTDRNYIGVDREEKYIVLAQQVIEQEYCIRGDQHHTHPKPKEYIQLSQESLFAEQTDDAA